MTFGRRGGLAEDFVIEPVMSSAGPKALAAPWPCASHQASATILAQSSPLLMQSFTP